MITHSAKKTWQQKEHRGWRLEVSREGGVSKIVLKRGPAIYGGLNKLWI